MCWTSRKVLTVQFWWNVTSLLCLKYKRSWCLRLCIFWTSFQLILSKWKRYKTEKDQSIRSESRPSGFRAFWPDHFLHDPCWYDFIEKNPKQLGKDELSGAFLLCIESQKTPNANESRDRARPCVGLGWNPHRFVLKMRSTFWIVLNFAGDVGNVVQAPLRSRSVLAEIVKDPVQLLEDHEFFDCFCLSRRMSFDEKRNVGRCWKFSTTKRRWTERAGFKV